MNIITSKLKYSLSIIGFVSLFTGSTYGQAELKSIDEVIDGIDSLLGDIKAQQPAPSPIIKPKPIPYQFGDSTTDPVPFRVNDELMPDMFLEPKEEQILDPLLEQPLNLDDVNPSADMTTASSATSMPLSGFDYRQASIEELLKEVDSLICQHLKRLCQASTPVTGSAPRFQ